jgi:predicted HD superfamily hydrolase involved in NAD metabolism
MDERNVWRSRASALVEASLSKPRLAHSREVARLASELCDRFHADEERGYIAGMAHDLARELPAAEMLLLAESDGSPVSEWERGHPLVLHGRAAAAVLTKHTGYADGETLQAIRDHVTGRGKMGVISRIVFAADFLEPRRDFVSPEFRRRTLALSLEEMVLAVLERKLHFLRADTLEIAPDSLSLREELAAHA